MRGPNWDDDRGSVSLWLITAAWAMIVIVGVVVDLSGQVYAQQHAHDIAAQAARAGGEQLNASQAIRGRSARADTTRAAAAARNYLAGSDVDGSVRILDGTTLIVKTTGTYRTRFLSIIGVDTMQVRGSASARIVRAVGGSEQ